MAFLLGPFTPFFPLAITITIFMGVMAFILCGFEHCVANMFYFSIAGVFSLKVIGYLPVMILGNSVGSILIALPYNRYAEKK